MLAQTDTYHHGKAILGKAAVRLSSSWHWQYNPVRQVCEMFSDCEQLIEKKGITMWRPR